MAGSKPRSESLRERSAGNSRRCVAVSDDYNMEGAEVKQASSEGEAMTFKFGSVVRSDKKSVFGVISDVSSGIAEGASAFCENMGDIIKNARSKKESKVTEKEIGVEIKQAEEKERIEFLEGKEKEKEVVGKAVKAKYSVEAAEAAIAPKEFGEVIRKREPEKKETAKISLKAEKQTKADGKESFDIKEVLNSVKEALLSGRKTVGIAAMCLVVFVGVIFTFANFTFAYSGDIDGTGIIVKSPEEFEEAVSRVNAKLTDSFGKEALEISADSVDLKKKLVKKNSFTPKEQLDNAIITSVDDFYEMYVVYAGERAILGVKDEDTAKQIIKEFKNYYTDGKEDVEFSTDKQIKYVCESAPASFIMSDVDAAVLKLNGGEKKENTYTVKQGDNMWSISQKVNTDVEKLLSMNGMTEDDCDINIGDKLVVEAFVPVVNVTTVEIVKRTKEIDYETEIIKDDSEYNTWSKVTQKGESGEAEVEEKITKVNGEVIDTEILNETIIKEPVKQIKKVGTKKPPSGVGSRSFIAPARGYISSRYGNRSRGFHTGLDIAGRYGSPIVAADHGKVVFVGWSGGYGKLVKIDHQNGYVTYYAHNSSFAVSVGQTVAKGQTIAYMGSTGNSTGNHCHFEIIKNGSRQNPEKYI